VLILSVFHVDVNCHAKAQAFPFHLYQVLHLNLQVFIGGLTEYQAIEASSVVQAGAFERL